MLKSTNPNPHGHDNLGLTGVRDDKIGLGVLSGDNDIVRYLILCFIQQYCFTLHGKVSKTLPLYNLYFHLPAVNTTSIVIQG